MAKSFIYKLCRFGLTGAICSLLYAVWAHAFIQFAGLDSVLSSALAYGLTVPVSFIGQKYFTFKARGKLRSELAGFFFTHGLGLLLAIVIMAAMELTPFDPVIGILAVMIAVPLISFVLMNTYVFKKPELN